MGGAPIREPPDDLVTHGRAQATGLAAAGDRRLTGVDPPYVLLSCAMSLGGYTADASAKPPRLSGDADIDRVHDVRAGCDATIRGAGPIRADEPVLLLR